MEAFADYKIDNVTYEYDEEDGNITITKISPDNETSSVLIPSAIEGIPVTRIACNACEGIEKCLDILTIPSSIKEIEAEAFKNSKIKKIVINNGIETLECETFYGISELTSVDIPNSVKCINNGAFEKCEKLESIIIPDSVTYIGNGAFSSCTKLTSVTISEESELETIDLYAFFGCSSLASIFIPKSVVQVEIYAFAGCLSLSDISVSSDNAVYDSRENCNAIIEKDTDKLIAGCKNTIFPSVKPITSIGWGAFASLDITTITIPGTVNTIGRNAFETCKDLKTVIILDGVKSIDRFAFNDCPNITKINIPKSVENIDAIFEGEKNLNRIIVDGDNERYDSRNNCNAIIEKATGTLVFGCDNTVIPNDVKIIGEFAFNNCNFDKISIPNSVTKIDKFAFWKCNNIKSLIIPKTVTDIGENVFRECSLDEVTIPKSVTSMGIDVFYNNSNKYLKIYVASEDQIDYVKSHSSLPDCIVKVHPHTGGTATCFKQKECDDCGAEYGDLLPHDFETTWTTDGTNHWHKCKNCTTIKDKTAHSGGTATCTDKAVCKDCKVTYGEANDHDYETVWTTDGTDHWHKCKNCDDIKDKGTHSGGTATCAKKAECEVCKAEYGELIGHPYSTVYTKATVNEDGKIESKCLVCDDEESTTIIYKPAKLVLSASEYAYDGKEQKPLVTVLDSKENVIPDTEYTVTYLNNKEIGNATVTVTFKGDKYEGLMTESFTISVALGKIKSLSNTAGGIKITWDKNSQVNGYVIYRSDNGGKYKKLATIKGSSKVTYIDTKVKNGSSYSYKIYPYKTVGKKDYYNKNGEAVKTYRLSTLTVKAESGSKGTVNVSYGKNAKASGYEVKLVNGKKATVVSINNSKTATKTISKLKANKTYKVYVRAVKKVGTNKYYSEWSKAVSVKVKK